MVDLITKIETRLRQASDGDRQYERPMSWQDADLIIEYVRRIEADLLHMREEYVNLYASMPVSIKG